MRLMLPPSVLLVLGCLAHATPMPEGVPMSGTKSLDVYHCDAAGSCSVCEGSLSFCEKPGQQVMCCPKACGDCTPAELMSQCDPATQVAVYCENGWSSPICSPDGGGFECLE